jgi:hypothetical protein
MAPQAPQASPVLLVAQVGHTLRLLTAVFLEGYFEYNLTCHSYFCGKKDDFIPF